MIETAASIHDFWFGKDFAAANDSQVAERQAKLWWGKDAQIDAAMGQRFAPLLEQAAMGTLDTWAASAGGLLSLVLLTDQFSRNIHRGKPQAFAADPLARRLAHQGLLSGATASLRPIEQVFMLLPFEHSEDLVEQQLSVREFEALAKSAPEPERKRMDGYLDYARRHLEIIARFGRFPHRNAILGRASTPEEIKFLQQPGSSF
jgi:uncharacterized protein (DUF924 family)